MPKVFLSHSSADKPFVEELFRRLTRDGAECFFDKDSIRPGDRISRSLTEALEDYEYFVLVYSPDYFLSRWASSEWESVIMKVNSGDPGKRILPILYRESEIPALLADLKYISFLEEAGGLDAAYPLLLQALGLQEVKALPEPAPLPQAGRSNVPHNSIHSDFVGRWEDAWRLHALLQERKIAVVQGIAGVGKTQLAVEYAYRFGEKFYPGGVIWVTATGGLEALIRQLREFTGQADKAFREEPEALPGLWRELAGKEPELVILDNFAGSPSELDAWIPKGISDIHILVTTRQTNFSALPKLRLKPMPGKDGLALVFPESESLPEEERALALELVEGMGGLPLALELTRNFLRLESNRGRRLQELLDAIREKGEIYALEEFTRRYGDEMPTGHEKSIARTFDFCIRQLKNPKSKELLAAMSFLAPDPVPRKLIRKILGFEDGNILNNPFGECLDELTGLSLVEVKVDKLDTLISCHPLLSSFIRSQELATEEIKNRVFASVEAEMARTRDPEIEGAYRSLELVLPHAEALMEQAEDQDWMLRVAKHIGYHHKRHGRYPEARQYFRQGFEIAQQLHDEHSAEVASIHYHLGRIIYELEGKEEGEAMMRKSLEIFLELPDYPLKTKHIARGKAYLGKVEYDKGNFRKALELQTEALRLNKLKFEADHPFVTFTQTNLATVYRALGEFETARDLLKETLRLNQRRFGNNPHHRFISKSKLRLANLYQDLGDYRRARRYFHEALVSTLETFDNPHHPRVTRCQYNLGNVLIEMEHFEEGIAYLRKALHANELNFGKEKKAHEYIAKVRSDLAVAMAEYGLRLNEWGQKEKAREELNRALLMQEEAYSSAKGILDADDKALIPMNINLGKVLMAKGLFSRARNYFEKALEANVELYGEAHPYTQRVKELMFDLEDLESENEEDKE